MSKSISAQISELGVSIWLDDLSKDRITSGSLAELVKQHNVVGITSNPTIFAQAIGTDGSYNFDIKELAGKGLSSEEIALELMIRDVRLACDQMAGVFAESGGSNGLVSLEVSPLLSQNAQSTISQAEEIWKSVDRPNLMVKIPATESCLPAITETIGSGINVNVTLIFSIDRYQSVLDAYFSGIELALSRRIDITQIRSVASFFVSRLDSAVDKLLDNLNSKSAAELRSTAAVANARLAYDLFEEAHRSERAASLFDSGMNIQRPLWASTGVKDPKLPETHYVVELAGPNVVNTMPEKTLLALSSLRDSPVDRISGSSNGARDALKSIEREGIALEHVTKALESAGLEQFVSSWHELLNRIKLAMESTT